MALQRVVKTEISLVQRSSKTMKDSQIQLHKSGIFFAHDSLFTQDFRVFGWSRDQPDDARAFFPARQKALGTRLWSIINLYLSKL